MDAKNIRSIVVATDLTQASDRALRAAAAISELTGAELHVLHVHVVPAGPYAAWTTPAEPQAAEAARQAERELEDQLRRAIPSRLAPASPAVVTAPSSSEAIRKYVEEAAADLVVLGPHRDSAADRPFLGTTADRLIRTARVPCLIVREPLDFPVQRVGVLTDFSPAAQAAQDTAAVWIGAFSGGVSPDAASGNGAKLSIAHIAWPMEGRGREALEAVEIRPELQKSIERSAARAGVSGQVEYLPEVLWTQDAVEAVEGWVRSRGLQMVVLGTQGISRLPYLHLGGLASTVARTAPCSVLLVPPVYASASLRGAESEVGVRKVVTAVDFHESSWGAALWVMRFLAPDAEHELVHVIEVPELPGPLRALGSNREQLRLAARNGAQRRLGELVDLGVSPRVGTHVQEGTPAAEIVRLAEETGADLIVVGEQGPIRGVRALLGSTAERVLLESRIPVLVARKVGDATPHRLLVAIDPSEVSSSVLAWARALVARFDATATVLNVVDRVLLTEELTGLPTAKTFQRLQEEATAAMQGWLEGKVREAGLPPERVRAEVLVGDPSYEIIAEAARQEADLVLVGSKGGDIARTPLIGRIVNKVVRSAPCSVLVVTPGGASA